MWVPSSALTSTPTASTLPLVFVPAAVTSSPLANVAACPPARVTVGCRMSRTAVPDSRSTHTTLACCSDPSAITAVTWVTPATALADVTSWSAPSTAADVVRFEEPEGITSCTMPGTIDDVGAAAAVMATRAEVAAPTRREERVAASSVAGRARWAT